MIDPNKPVYLRLRDTIANAILDGKYGDGDMLPSVRALAAEEGANPLTVAKAYQRLAASSRPDPPHRHRRAHADGRYRRLNPHKASSSRT